MAERMVICILRIVVTIYTYRSPVALMSFRGVPRGVQALIASTIQCSSQYIRC